MKYATLLFFTLLASVHAFAQAPAPITGVSNVCLGSTAAFSDDSTGGAWSSGASAVATIGAGTGILTAISLGTATITYTTTGGTATTTVTVVGLPCGPSPGFSNVCAGATVAEGCSGISGTWTSSNTSIATVGSLSGIVSGVVAGSVSLTFTAALGCSSSGLITVYTAPPPIFGPTTPVCPGGSVSLGDFTTGGSWSSANTAVATVSATGHVSGVSAGTVTIQYANSSGCMTGRAVTVNPSPTVYTLTLGGSYCSGGTGVDIKLNWSDTGIQYQLFIPGGATPPAPLYGIGDTLDFGYRTAPAMYKAIAYDPTTGCSDTMNGSPVVSVNPLPSVYSIAGGGAYCAGGAGEDVVLSASDFGVSYQLFHNSVPIGLPIAGTGASMNFGLQTAAGTYSVVATNTITGCTRNMTGSVSITVSPLPVISGALAVCAGSSITDVVPGFTGGTWSSGNTGIITISGLTGTMYGVSPGPATITYTSTAGCSATEVVTVAVSPAPISGTTAICAGATTTLSPTGGVWSSAIPTVATISALTGIVTGVAPGTTTISFSLGSGCTSAAIITVNPLPAPITGSGSLCGGGLTNDSTILSDAMTGGAWVSANTGIATVSSAGLVRGISPGTAAITYTSFFGCSVTKIVTANALPAVFTLGGGGSYCSGGAGVDITLSGSDGGITYRLYDETSAVGSATGTGMAIDFGLHTPTGIYTAIATNSNGCSIFMSGVDTIATLPLPTAYTVAGGGSYCYGGTGADVSLSNSDAGISYQLYEGITAAGSAVSGTGVSIDFGVHLAGTYTVVATNTATGCSAPMTGSAAISVVSLPASYTVIGGGVYCSGGAGVAIGLSSSSTADNYQLLNGGVPVGAVLPGIGAALDFGFQTAAGTYTVIAIDATYGCVASMPGSATVTVSPSPFIDTVTGGGTRCAVGPGLNVGLDGSFTGINYKLYNTTTLISTQSGTGGPFNFGLEVLAGTYTVVAVNASTGCTANMSGSATITNITPATPSVTITAAPGDTVCQGTVVTYTATIINGGSTPSYQWTVNGISPVSTASTYSYIPANNDVIYLTIISSATCVSPITVISPDIVMDVYTLPPITGASALCSGADITLSDTLGGIWTSSNPAVATIATIGASTGVLSGVGPGTATITYSLGAGCSVSASFMVHPSPVITATYTTDACGGGYTLSASGGDTYSWAPSAGMSCAGCATTDVIPTATTHYVVTGTNSYGCSDTAGVTVDGNRISGYITIGSSGSLEVWLIQFDPFDSSLIAIDSVTTCTSGGSPYYEFDDEAAGSYMVKAYLPGGIPGASGYIPTYGFSSPHWSTANAVTHASAADTLHINMIYGTVPSGPGFIGGLISSGAGRGTDTDVPAEGMLVYLTDAASGQVLTYTYTDATGAYSFNNLAYYDYVIYPEQFDYNTTASAFISINSLSDSVTGADFKRHTTAKTITPISGLTGTNTLPSPQSGIQVYPNPASGNLNIQWTSLREGSAPVVITDAVGREVYRSEVNINAVSGKTLIDISSLKSGIYIISIKAEGVDYNGKLMVE